MIELERAILSTTEDPNAEEIGLEVFRLATVWSRAAQLFARHDSRSDRWVVRVFQGYPGFFCC